jgi:hypothetical protein
MMLAVNMAVRACSDPARIPFLHQPIEAGIVIGKPLIELHDGESELSGNAVGLIHRIISVSEYLPYVKGYLRIHQTFALSLPLLATLRMTSSGSRAIAAAGTAGFEPTRV